jgi:hypothetical protein
LSSPDRGACDWFRLTPPSGPTGRSMTAQGHPRAIFQRAVERGNLVVAEATARELGQLTLEEAVRLLFLYAEKEPVKFERAALRWLSRYLTEGKAVSLLKAQLALSALAELRAGEREAAAKILTELVRRSSRPHKRQKPAKEADFGTVPCAMAMSLKSEDDIATRTVVSSQFEGVGVAGPTP